MNTVCINPWVDRPGESEGGIARVIEGQIAALGAHGWEAIADPEKADVINCHVQVPPSWLRNYSRRPLVVSNHGLYWSPEYPWEEAWHFTVNQHAIDAIRVADIVTAPSHWVANALARASMRDVRAIHHGIDTDDWQPPDEPGGYVLWNKSRPDPVCDPGPPTELARLMPDVPFISTFSHSGQSRPPNMRVTGNLPFSEARAWIVGAGVYLATTRETFGVGTLEALACGVPVVGWAWGGQTEIITHGRDGWLVTPGDIEGLAEGVRWALDRDARPDLMVDARQCAKRFTLDKAAAQYAEAFEDALERRRRHIAAPARPAPPRVSVIVTAYNLAKYLPACLDSLIDQTYTDWECIVVDDASPDESADIARTYAEHDGRFRLVRHTVNRYLAAARNTGIELARGEYIVPLDADDKLAPATLATLAHALDHDRGLHIAYGNVLFVDEDGTPSQAVTGRGQSVGHSGWPMPFNFEWMMRGPGQLIPVCSMFRREVWEHTGGYRERCRSSEDQDFWLRATSYGFVAQMVTRDDTLIYRRREDSMSSSGGEGWEEHRGWYPWAGPDGDRSLVPAAAYREGAAQNLLPVPTLDPIIISVVIPVGPGHGQYVVDAVDSVDAQTFRNWECIVVNDSGADLPRLPSWVRVLCSDATCPDQDGDACHSRGAGAYPWPSGNGVAVARNKGIATARGRMFLPLDADDYLQPRALQLMLAAHREDPSRPAVYSDFWQDRGDGDVRLHRCDDYDPRLVLGGSRTFEGERRTGMLHAVTTLTPVEYWREVGGYDEALPAWEDWAFEIAMAAKGYCERRVAQPLFTYRMSAGQKREADLGAFERSKAAIMAKDFGLGPGGELMACSSCQGGRKTTAMGAPISGGAAAVPASSQQAAAGELVKVRYVGRRAGTVRYNSKVATGVLPYAFSSVQPEQYVRAGDVDWLTAHPDFVRVDDAAPVAVGAAAAAPVAPQRPSVPVVTASRTPPPPPPVAFEEEQIEVVQPPPAAAEAEAEAAAPPADEDGDDGDSIALTPAAKALMSHTRTELEKIALDEGILEPEDRSNYPNKATLAAVIAAKRTLGI